MDKTHDIGALIAHSLADQMDVLTSEQPLVIYGCPTCCNYSGINQFKGRAVKHCRDCGAELLCEGF